MTVVEKLIQHVKALPGSLQAEVLDFVEYLESKAGIGTGVEDEGDWSSLSLSQAMRGMESEPTPYTTGDLKENFS